MNQVYLKCLHAPLYCRFFQAGKRYPATLTNEGRVAELRDELNQLQRIDVSDERTPRLCVGYLLSAPHIERAQYAYFKLLPMEVSA